MSDGGESEESLGGTENKGRKRNAAKYKRLQTKREISRKKESRLGKPFRVRKEVTNYRGRNLGAEELKRVGNCTQ